MPVWNVPDWQNMQSDRAISPECKSWGLVYWYDGIVVSGGNGILIFRWIWINSIEFNRLHNANASAASLLKQKGMTGPSNMHVIIVMRRFKNLSDWILVKYNHFKKRDRPKPLEYFPAAQVLHVVTSANTLFYRVNSHDCISMHYTMYGAHIFHDRTKGF